MFSFMKKKRTVDLFSPVNGTLVKLEDVPDQVFAQKMMGEGVAFKFTENTLYSPCDGELAMVADTLHAYGFKLSNGAEALIHIGLDTVNLNGEGFKLIASQGQKVHVGDPIVEIDQEFMKTREIDLTTPMVVTNGSEYKMSVQDSESDVKIKESVVIHFD